MKKYLLVSAFLAAMAGLYVNAQSKILSLNFVAPQVISTASVFNPQIGEIVYQSSDSTFYGYNNQDPVNPWVPLSGGGSSSLPAGTIVPFAGSSAPSGFMIANGDTLNVDDHADLYAAIGTTYGGTGGSGGTFKLPDLRGIFVRGAGSQTISSITYSGTLAATQNDQMQGHRHSTTPIPVRQSDLVASGSTSDYFRISGDIAITSGDPTTDGTNGTPRTGAETRPANISLTYLIKL